MRMNYLLADIGGTHARCALFDGEEISNIEVISANDYSNGQDLFLSYIAKHVRPEAKLSCMIAAAGRMDKDGIWRVGNNNDWQISPDAMKGHGHEVENIIGDFVATSAGVVCLEDNECLVLHKGEKTDCTTKAICGPGTGIGLSYIINVDGKPHIHRTHGGHMGAVSQTAEQQAIILRLQQINNADNVSFEDICSGRSLLNLYQATCDHLNAQPNLAIQKAEDILKNADDYEVKETLRLFHEFLGLFLQTILTTGHAYGGIYLDGGVIQKLNAHNLLDTKSILKYAHSCSNSIVEASLKSAPIYLINTPYIALTGLKNIIKGDVSA